jgi:hypothetical protein
LGQPVTKVSATLIEYAPPRSSSDQAARAGAKMQLYVQYGPGATNVERVAVVLKALNGRDALDLATHAQTFDSSGSIVDKKTERRVRGGYSKNNGSFTGKADRDSLRGNWKDDTGSGSLSLDLNEPTRLTKGRLSRGRGWRPIVLSVRGKGSVWNRTQAEAIVNF